MERNRHLKLPGLMAIDAPYSHAVTAGELVFVAGQLAQDDPAWQGPNTIEGETAASLDLCSRILGEAGLSMADVVRVTVYMTDLSEFKRMNQVYARYFPADRQPARTCVGVASLLAGARIEIDCIAFRDPNLLAETGL
ncbi:2-iminobutanoate/2-iminopropanoate deaminase [Rhodoligotrophos appendicifer]|uniref:RidA family protein n=1 Tax=Rhodoligotrophos appendicifer TaxID=987056 RepID=UPI0014786A58|nr:RidA family protein [Rhodoligotrophos appendicifer]